MDMKIDADTLRRERLRRALTQRELADRAGVSYVTISRIENDASGPVKPPTLRKIAEALGVVPEVLIRWDDGDAESGTKNSPRERATRRVGDPLTR
jgi:transcriptional regulator with XRE-family HTH domain